MTSVTYSTPNANYTQVYAVHTRRLDDPVLQPENFSSVDAVVLELYHDEKWFKAYWQTPYKKLQDPLFEAVQKTQTPLYVVDVLTTKGGIMIDDLVTYGLDGLGVYVLVDGIQKMRSTTRNNDDLTRRQFLTFWGSQISKVVGGSLLASHFAHERYTIETGDNPEFLARLNSARMHLVPSPRFELRNAITARKVEEFIVPELNKKIGRKPHIAIVYGAGHSGLKEDLQNPSLRNTYLSAYASMGYPGIETIHLDTITNVTINDLGNFSLEHRTANLF